MLFRSPGSGRSSGGGHGNPLLYSCLQNLMDRGTWQPIVHGVAKSQTRLSDFTFTFHFHALEKEMATHSCILACRIPGTGEPGGLPSMGSHRVGHPLCSVVKNTLAMRENWVRSLGWAKAPGGGHGYPPQHSCLENPHGQRSLVGYTVHGVTKSRTRLSD